MANQKQEELQELLVWNPLLYSKRKKYIWYDREMEQRLQSAYLFGRLLQMNVYIDGFATDYEPDVDVWMYHKPIVNIRELSAEEAVVFVAAKHKRPPYAICEEIKVLNSALQTDHVTIYGAGANGDFVWKYLTERGISIDQYIDQDALKTGKKKNGVFICGVNRLDQMSQTDVIVEALNQYEQADQLICRHNHFKNRFFYKYESNQIGAIFYGSKLLFRTYVISLMNVAFGSKNIYVYGTSLAAQDYAKKLQLLDFNFRGFLCDYEAEMGFITDYPVKYVEEILYEDDYFVMVETENEYEAIDKLESFGLKYAIDFSLVGPAVGSIWDRRCNLLDVNLGCTYRSKDDKFSGITVYGNENKEDYKIAVLGESTTDAGLYPFKTWTEFLYECWPDRAVTVYNAGVAGYNSAQQLIKLIRDILPLKPDMLIVYGGYNDTHINPKAPFAFDYVKRIFEFANQNMENQWKKEYDGLAGADCTEKVIYSASDCMDVWISNVELMHTIAISKGIKFYDFMQPMLGNKRNKTKEEVGLLLSATAYYGNDTYMRIAEQFREEVRSRRIEEEYDYIFDLSHIFDDVEDVYLDEIHVKEKGNEIIAHEILQRIL